MVDSLVDGDHPTLRALLERSELALRLLSPESLADGACDRAIRWVHSSDLADPTPFLSEGLALLTTGTQFVDDEPESFEAYVARLHERGVVALGFGTEVARAGVPPLLADACAARGMPLFEVPYGTPFIAVARANAEAVAARAYRRRSWALAAQRAIALAALRSDGLGATLAELARQLDTWVGLFDSGGKLSREHPRPLGASTADELQREVDAVLRRGARAASSMSIAGRPFTLQTLGRGGHLRGVIAIASGELDQEGRSVLTSVIAMAGLALEQNEGLTRTLGLLRTGLLHSLLRDDPTLARRIASEMWGGLPTAPVLVAALDLAAARRHAVTEWLELRAERTPGTIFFGRGDRAFVVIVPETARGLLDELASATGHAVGVSEPARYDALSRAHAQAVFARDHSAGPVTTYAEAGRRSVLDSLPDESTRIGAAVLAPLVRHDAEHATDLLTTLRTHLECDARPEATARRLGIHRHTVRSRVALAERVLGRDLSTFAARADLWAAFVASDAHPS